MVGDNIMKYLLLMACVAVLLVNTSADGQDEDEDAIARYGGQRPSGRSLLYFFTTPQLYLPKARPGGGIYIHALYN